MLNNVSIARSGPAAVGSFRLFSAYLYLFAATLAVQTGHMVEHLVQMSQKFILHVPAHGLIGQWDIEQVHFGFNTVYYTLLFPLLVGWITYRSEIPLSTRRWSILTGAFLFTLLAQSYHQVEHSVKLVQFINTHMQGTTGILGAHFDLVIVHFVLNVLVYGPLLVVFFGAGLHRRVRIGFVGGR